MIFDKDVQEYIKDHRGIKEAVNAMINASKEVFPNQPSELSVYRDPEVDDSWVLLTVAFGEYPEDISMRLNKVKQAYLPLLKNSEGWCSVVVTHKL